VSPLAACATPLVYLSDAKFGDGPKFTHPATRKALASFADIDAVTDTQADARIAHLHETMREEDPRFFCSNATKAEEPRIDVNGGK
jgi:hypothetical protein